MRDCQLLHQDPQVGATGALLFALALLTGAPRTSVASALKPSGAPSVLAAVGRLRFGGLGVRESAAQHQRYTLLGMHNRNARLRRRVALLYL